MTVEYIRKYISKSSLNYKQMIEFVINNLSEQIIDKLYKSDYRYTRNLIYRNQEFELMVLRWPPKCSSLIHDHSNSDCFFALKEGVLVSDCYSYKDKELKETCLFELKSDRVYSSVEGNAQDIHRIKNTSDKPAYTVHLYSKPLLRFNVYCQGKPVEKESVGYDKIL